MGGAAGWVESLERRTLLSGVVRTVFADGLLQIIGDNAANAVFVQRAYADPDPSALEVIGREGTLINGVTQRGGFHFSGVREIQVFLHDGDDQVHLVGLRLAGGVTIDPGANDDDVFIRKSRIHGNTLLGSGRDGDTLTVADTFFGNDLIVYDKRGAMSVSLRDSVFGDNLSISTGPEADRLTINNCFVEGFSGFATGKGDDFIRIADGSEFKQATGLDDGEGDDQVYREVVRRFDFDKGKQGWKPYFSNYPAGQFIAKDAHGQPQTAEEALQLASGIKSLPESRADQRRGFYLAGVNGTDAMLFFIGRSFAAADGLLPGVTYQLQLEFTYNSPAPPIVRHLSAGLLAGPIQLKLVPEQFTSHSNLLLLAGDGRSFAEPAGELSRIADLMEGVVHHRHTLPRTVMLGPSGQASVVVALKNEFEDFAAIYFESVLVRFVPQIDSST